MFSCQYCEKSCKNKNSLSNHELRCSLNPNKRVFRTGMLGKKGRNQYMKAKDNGSVYILSEESREKIRAASSARKHTDETKKILSEKRKQYLEKNPDKVPYVLNHSSKKSYPEQYFEDCFSNIVKDKEINYPVLRYHLDFANPSKKIYLEIDGEQHYVDKKIIEHDKKRTEKLANLGWNVLRIRWAEFKKLSPLEQKQRVSEIKKLMNWE